MTRVFIGTEGQEPTIFRVERARGYGDKLVLKLLGIDDPNAAEALRGRIVLAPPEEVPPLAEGEHFVAHLVGLTVLDERGEAIGAIVDVRATGGTDLLVIEEKDGEELLVPLAKDVVPTIDEVAGVVHVRLPEGLRRLNRRDREGA